jgi:crotonobetainyl-CoA:carnitine CoA-transferase CaiB-like acyl-CoA transferase
MDKEHRLTLKGVTVADFSHALSAPYGSMLLADQGADIIKIENPSGDIFRDLYKGAYAVVVHRNKRTITLDLKQKEGKEIAWEIIKKADVVIENFTPGAMEKLGFGYEEVKALNPRIIYCSLSGYGQTGPYSHLGGYDVVAQAMSGIMAATGDPDRLPVRVGPSIVDMGSGMYLAMGILLALMDREKTGLGQRIEISLLETALSWMSPFVAVCSVSGEVPKRWGSGFAPLCPYKVFEAADGPVFIGVSSNSFWEKFCKAFNLDELYAREEFKDINGRVKNRDEIDGLVQHAMKGFKSADIINRLREAGVPCSPVNSVKDAMEDIHVKARNCLVTMDHPVSGKITFVRNPISRDEEFPDVRFPSPSMGQHTYDILRELGYLDEQIEKFISLGAAVPEKK